MALSSRRVRERLELSRRELLATVPAAFVAGTAFGQAPPPKVRPRIAAIVTDYRFRSHAQGIVDRFLDGYGWEGRHYVRASISFRSTSIRSRRTTLAAEREARHPGLKVYPTIAEALTRGGNGLAVDGVLLIGEHGNYPRNEKGQTLYPRYEFFQQIVDVFKRSGRAVPVFNDKHLSWNWELGQDMVETARNLGFPLMAGSSLPVTWRIPAVDVPFGAEVAEAVCVGYGGSTATTFTASKRLQCLVERRKGGETGVTRRDRLARRGRLEGACRPARGMRAGATSSSSRRASAAVSRLSLAPTGVSATSIPSSGRCPRSPATRSCTASNTPTASKAHCSCSSGLVQRFHGGRSNQGRASRSRPRCISPACRPARRSRISSIRWSTTSRPCSRPASRPTPSSGPC